MAATLTDHLPLRPKICAWCESPMGVESPRCTWDTRPNHGLCGDCTEQLLESLLSDSTEADPIRWSRPQRRRVTRVASAR